MAPSYRINTAADIFTYIHTHKHTLSHIYVHYSRYVYCSDRIVYIAYGDLLYSAIQVVKDVEWEARLYNQ